MGVEGVLLVIRNNRLVEKKHAITLQPTRACLGLFLRQGIKSIFSVLVL
jgi:hypothetical protein